VWKRLEERWEGGAVDEDGKRKESGGKDGWGSRLGGEERTKEEGKEKSSEYVVSVETHFVGFYSMGQWCGGK